MDEAEHSVVLSRAIEKVYRECQIIYILQSRDGMPDKIISASEIIRTDRGIIIRLEKHENN